MTAPLNDLTFRKARPGELDEITSIIYAEPAEEEVAIAGSVELARKWGREQVRLRGLANMHLGEMNGEAVVVIEVHPAAKPRGLAATLHLWKSELMRSIAWARVFGVGALPRYLRVRRAEGRVYVPPPDDAYHISEMTTTEKYRYSGIGAHARVFSEKEARRLGYKKMSLHTSTINPTKDMVMRHGYELVATRTDPSYERIAGIAGWHLLVKELKERVPRAATPEPAAASATGDGASPGDG